MARRGVAAVVASACARFAALGVAVALATLAMREVPESGLALPASSAVGVCSALASASFHVALIVERAHAVAIARHAALGAEAISPRRTSVARSSHHVGLAGTRAPIRIAKQTVGARGVTVAS